MSVPAAMTDPAKETGKGRGTVGEKGRRLFSILCPLRKYGRKYIIYHTDLIQGKIDHQI